MLKNYYQKKINFNSMKRLNVHLNQIQWIVVNYWLIYNPRRYRLYQALLKLNYSPRAAFNTVF